MIYFIREKNEHDSRMKVGYTSQNPDSRCAELQTGNSIALDVAWYIPGDIETERLCQEYFKEFNIRGEWYLENDEFDKKFRWFALAIRNICNDCLQELLVPGDAFIPSIKKWLRFENNVTGTGSFCVITARVHEEAEGGWREILRIYIFRRTGRRMMYTGRIMMGLIGMM